MREPRVRADEEQTGEEEAEVGFPGRRMNVEGSSGRQERVRSGGREGLGLRLVASAGCPPSPPVLQGEGPQRRQHERRPQCPRQGRGEVPVGGRRAPLVRAILDLRGGGGGGGNTP